MSASVSGCDRVGHCEGRGKESAGTHRTINKHTTATDDHEELLLLLRNRLGLGAPAPPSDGHHHLMASSGPWSNLGPTGFENAIHCSIYFYNEKQLHPENI